MNSKSRILGVFTVLESPRPPLKPPQITPWPKSSPEEALGGPRGAWGGSGRAPGELWEALYIEKKLPINRKAAVMLRNIIRHIIRHIIHNFIRHIIRHIYGILYAMFC